MAQPGYASDLTEAQWARLAPLLPPPGVGPPRQHEPRVIVNAILYVLRTGCQWRMLPHDFPPGRRSTITSGSGATRGSGNRSWRPCASRSGAPAARPGAQCGDH